MRGARIAIGIAGLVGCALTGAQAASDSADITVTGSVDRLCVLSNPQVDLGRTTNIGQVSGSTVRIADLSDDEMTTKSTDFIAELPGMCNMGHQITISSDRGGLWRFPAGLPVAGFANGVPYRATVAWGGTQTTLLAPASSQGPLQQILSVDQPAGGDIEIHFHIDQSASNAGSGTPLVAGTYQDTIRVTMGPL